MGAICGLFYKNNAENGVNHLIQRMIGSIPKFGQETANSWYDKNIAFAGLELPFYDRNSHLLITTYARIDNRNDLCHVLGISNNQDLHDRHIILQLYQKFGKDFPAKILGDFAIAIWDETKQELFCASDIMNLRPIFYFNDNNLFAFATEIKALHTIPEIVRAPDLIRVANQIVIDNFYISNDYRSYYAGINYIPGATTLKVTRHNISSHTYWQTDLTKRLHYKTENEYVDAFNDIFTESIKARTKTTNQIGVMLSGGLDSSAITAMTTRMFKQDNRSLEAFCNVLPLDYTGKIEDERKYIGYLKTDNLNINFIDHPTDGPFDHLFELIKHVEYPNYISQQYIHKEITAKLKEKNVRVLLDGVYGEMGPSFPGYGYFAAFFLTGQWGKLIRESYLKAHITKQNWPKFLLKSTISPLIPDRIRELIKSNYKERTAHTGLLLNAGFVNKYSTLVTQKDKLRFGIPSNMFNQRQNQANFIHYKQHTHPLTCYMEKSGVELLHPYLDRRILEFCLAMPNSMRIKNGYNRYMIRRAMRGIMPDEICKRTTKAAFIPDYMERYAKDLPKAQALLEHISSNPLVQEIIDLNKLARMIHTANSPGSFMGGQNIQAFMVVPTTLALGVFLTTFPP